MLTCLQQVNIKQQWFNSGTVYVSSDYGQTWTEKIIWGDSAQAYMAVKVSSTGQYQTAAALGEGIYTSNDYGATWTVSSTLLKQWSAIAMSSDGHYQALLGGYQTNLDQIYTSSDYGATWTARDSSRSWSAIAMSSDGQYQTATVGDNANEISGQIYTSSNYGVTWTARESNRYWKKIAMSSDGAYQTAIAWGGQIYTSSNYGVTWTARNSSRNWLDVEMSSSGAYQTAIHYGGQIHTSSDYGVTWIARESSRNWYDVEMSPTGQFQTAVVWNGLIYVSNNYTGGSTANCSANLKQDGACGTANGHNYAYTDTDWGAYTQCSVGTPSTTAFPAMGGSTNWTCSGINGGNISSTCTATRSSPTNKSRQYYYAESIAESSYNTDTNYQDKTTLTFTPDDNSTYLIIASWLMRQSWTSTWANGKLTRTTGTPKDFNELIYLPKDATDYISGGTIGIDTFSSSPDSQTYKIQYATSNTSGTTYMKEAKIVALKLSSADKYAESEEISTTTSTSYQDKTTLTFTPDTAGDYIIIATATVYGSSTSYDFRTQLSVDGVASSTSNIETANTSNRYLWGIVKKVNLTAASHTIKIQYSTESSSYSAKIAHARIVALRADEFNNNYYNAEQNQGPPQHQHRIQIL